MVVGSESQKFGLYHQNSLESYTPRPRISNLVDGVYFDISGFCALVLCSNIPTNSPQETVLYN